MIALKESDGGVSIRLMGRVLVVVLVLVLEKAKKIEDENGDENE